MKILFITYNFPPFNSVGAVRTGKTAKYLIESGHDVKVVSCGNQTLANNLSLEISTQCVEYTSWINVNSPVEFALGGKKRVAVKGFLPSSSHLPNWIVEMGAHYRNLLNFPDGQIGWYPFAKRAGEGMIRQWKPDLIFASAMPYTSLLIASTLSKKYKIPWIAELRDLWVDNHQRVRPAWRHFFENRLEQFVLSSACGLVTVSNVLAETLQAKYTQPCAVITNGFDPDDYPNSLGNSFSEGIIHLVHTGQLFGVWRNPAPLFLALQQMGDDANKVRLHFYGRQSDLSTAFVKEHGVDHILENHEPVSHIEALKIQSEADILIIIPGSKTRGVYTTKLFEYLGARRPILCIGNTDGVAANLICERNAGIALNDPEKIGDQLKKWIQQKKDTGKIPYLPADVGKGFTRKEQTEKLVKFFQSCLQNTVST